MHPITFDGVEPPNSITEEAANWLRAGLDRGMSPDEEAVQASLTIQRAIENEEDVQLSTGGRKAVIAVLDNAFGPGGVRMPDGAPENLRWLQMNL